MKPRDVVVGGRRVGDRSGALHGQLRLQRAVHLLELRDAREVRLLVQQSVRGPRLDRLQRALEGVEVAVHRRHDEMVG